MFFLEKMTCSVCQTQGFSYSFFFFFLFLYCWFTKWSIQVFHHVIVVVAQWRRLFLGLRLPLQVLSGSPSKLGF